MPLTATNYFLVAHLLEQLRYPLCHEFFSWSAMSAVNGDTQITVDLCVGDGSQTNTSGNTRATKVIFPDPLSLLLPPIFLRVCVGSGDETIPPPPASCTPTAIGPWGPGGGGGGGGGSRH